MSGTVDNKDESKKDKVSKTETHVPSPKSVTKISHRAHPEDRSSLSGPIGEGKEKDTKPQE